jgi:hypothetical protein
VRGAGASGSAEAQAAFRWRGDSRLGAGLGRLHGLPVLLGFVLPVAFMLRPLAADWSVLPWDRLCGLVVQQRAARSGHRLGGRRHGAVAGFQCAP